MTETEIVKVLLAISEVIYIKKKTIPSWWNWKHFFSDSFTKTNPTVTQNNLVPKTAFSKFCTKISTNTDYSGTYILDDLNTNMYKNNKYIAQDNNEILIFIC